VRDWAWCFAVVVLFVVLAVIWGTVLCGIWPTNDEVLRILLGPHAQYL